MNRRTAAFAAIACAVALPLATRAADHIDGPAATNDPAADITDVYAWMSSDASKVNLVLNTFHDVGATGTFSQALQYVFHVNSSAAYGMAQTETLVLCEFPSATRIQCWAGDEYVEGDPSDPAGIESASGALRVFAGRRDDPFFFELVGFNETTAIVRAAAPSLVFDADGCPAIDAPTSAALVGQLQHGMSNAPASDFFDGRSVLSLVVQVDKEVVTPGGPVIGVWGSTNQAQ